MIALGILRTIIMQQHCSIYVMQCAENVVRKSWLRSGSIVW
jgi:hypothetical protein